MKIVVERPEDKPRHRRVRIRAAETERSMSDIVNEALDRYLDEDGHDRKGKR